jgi:Predicted nucleic-acid-binding protein, contains PIN domain
MNGKFFLDTNVFVYMFDTRVPSKSDCAIKLVKRAIGSKRGVVSYQVVQEFFNVALGKFEKQFPADEAEYQLTTVFRPLLAVHSSPRLFLEAIRIKNAHRISWYDSLIIAAALEANCEILYSEDLQTGRKIEGLVIENPFIDA